LLVAACWLLGLLHHLFEVCECVAWLLATGILEYSVFCMMGCDWGVLIRVHYIEPIGVDET
jgi:hypothetical protein